MLGFFLFFFSVKSEICGDLCQNTLNESGSIRAFCETEYGSAFQQLTDKTCIFACDVTSNSTIFGRKCDACELNPPMTEKMCIHACKKRYIVNKSLDSICEKCLASKLASDDSCIYSCAYTVFDWFRRICDQCKANQAFTEDTSTKFDNTDFRNVCEKCVANPPVNEKMCIYACSNRENNTRFRRICAQCVAKLPPTMLIENTCIYACHNRKTNNRLKAICVWCTESAPLTEKMCIEVISRKSERKLFNLIGDQCAANLPLTSGMCIYACGNRKYSYVKRRAQRICVRCVHYVPLTEYI